MLSLDDIWGPFPNPDDYGVALVMAFDRVFELNSEEFRVLLNEVL